MGISGVFLLLSGLAYAIIGIKKKMYVESNRTQTQTDSQKGYTYSDRLPI